MPLLERYIFRRILLSYLAILITLCAVVWLTQGVRELDLITVKGQTMGLFVTMTGLLLPVLVMVISPFALFFAISHVLSGLHADSELVIILSQGRARRRLIRPVLLMALISALLVGSISLYLAPKSLNTLRYLITQVRADFVSNVLREGVFTSIETGLIFNIRERRANGDLVGVFLYDTRKPDDSLTYIANVGRIITEGEQQFLMLESGSIHRVSKRSEDVSIIDFEVYLIDLSDLGQKRETEVAFFKPRERSTGYLLNPDPTDPSYQAFKGRFRAELHDRLVNPLYSFAFALVLLTLWIEPKTTRQSKAGLLLFSLLACIALRTAGFGATSLVIAVPQAVALVYVAPLMVMALCALAINRGYRFNFSSTPFTAFLARRGLQIKPAQPS